MIKITNIDKIYQSLYYVEGMAEQLLTLLKKNFRNVSIAFKNLFTSTIRIKFVQSKTPMSFIKLHAKTAQRCILDKRVETCKPGYMSIKEV